MSGFLHRKQSMKNLLSNRRACLNTCFVVWLCLLTSCAHVEQSGWAQACSVINDATECAYSVSFGIARQGSYVRSRRTKSSVVIAKLRELTTPNSVRIVESKFGRDSPRMNSSDHITLKFTSQDDRNCHLVFTRGGFILINQTVLCRFSDERAFIPLAKFFLFDIDGLDK